MIDTIYNCRDVCPTAFITGEMMLSTDKGELKVDVGDNRNERWAKRFAVPNVGT